MDKTLFGERLRALRKERSLQQSELGAIFEISPSAIGSYERGLREPAYPILVAFAKYFGVSVDYMLGVADERMSLEAFLTCNRLNLEDIMAKYDVALKGVPLTIEEKTRLMDMATAMMWSRLDDSSPML